MVSILLQHSVANLRYRDFVNESQQKLGMIPTAGTYSETTAALIATDDGMSDELVDSAQTFALPECELGNLIEVENLMRMANNSAHGRDALTKYIIGNDYVAKLVPLVEVAEDFESLTDLHRLCNIVKTIILLNDNAIIEQVVRDDNMMGVLGALEYDPEFPGLKANHRKYLSDPSRFKEIVKIEDPNVRQKIHYTFRLHYLKDVVLARILDDPTFSVLNSLIFFNQIEIIQHIHSNVAFLTELFALVKNPEVDSRRKRDAISFLQQCCSIAKGLQVNIRASLYSNFLNAGLFPVITFALKQPDTAVRVAGTDILIALIEHDALLMRGQIFRSLNEKAKPLTDILIEMLLVEPDLGVKCQLTDALKVLLDPIANAQSVDALSRSNGDFVGRPRNPHGISSGADQFVQHFYEESCKKLFAPLRELDKRPSMSNLTPAEGQLYSQLIEILCFFIRNHSYRTKPFLSTESLPLRISRLFQCPEKHLKLLALKYFRATLALHDPFHYHQIVLYNVVDPILDILLETMPKDNLLNSACLDFFEMVRRQENNKDLITYLAEKLREKLEKLAYMETFRLILQKYEHMNTAPPDELSFTTVDTEQPSNNRAPGTSLTNGQRWHQGLKEMDPEEETYFNTSDGDEDDEVITPLAVKSEINGASPAKRLVSYDDDDEDELDLPMNDEDELTEPHVNGTTGVKEPASVSAESKALTPEPSPPPPSEVSAAAESASRDETPSPPERLVEKRKRQVDETEEDELGKLSSLPKRRSSVGSTASIGSMVSTRSARKRTLSLTKEKEKESRGGAVKKISITLGSKGTEEPKSGETD
jgi:protein phosphatase 4 regulatory subunit 3